MAARQSEAPRRSLRAGGACAPLPVQLTRFIGREREVADARRLLGATRLLTLTGAGGSGKTRLALEIATRAQGELPVAWVELAGLSDGALLAQHVGAQLGLGEQSGGADARKLVELLGEEPLLLVLDNCEHVVEASAALADALLRGCPGLRILATSREALGIGGERAWLMPPLGLPPGDVAASADAAAAADAVRLFVERAQDALPTFTLTNENAGAVVEICRRLDGLPLAIELAAARVRVLPPEQIRARLHDAFQLLTSHSRTAIPRHRTLRATIAWSYALLQPEEQLLLERLSVFGGGFTLEAAETVGAGAPIEAGAVLDVLARLVDRSLVVMREADGSARYALLETVRQYGAERLRARGDEAARLEGAHARFFAALAAEAEPHLTAASRPPWLARLNRELDNLRQALAWTRAHEPELHLGLVGSLGWFWFANGYWSEGRRWAEAALALPVAAPRTRERAAALFAASVIVSLQAKNELARPWLEEALSIAQELGDERLAAYALNYLGMALIQQARPEGEAVTHAALAWFRDHDDLYGARLSLLLLGTLAVARGQLDTAIVWMEQGVVVARAFGLPRELGIASQMLGSMLLRRGDAGGAAPLLRESLIALRHDPQYMFLARGLEITGLLAGERGDDETALRLLAAGEALRERIGAGVFEADKGVLALRRDALQAALGDAAFARRWTEARGVALEDAIALALGVTSEAGKLRWREGETTGRLAVSASSILAPPAGDGSHEDAAPSPSRPPAVAPSRLEVLALGPLSIRFHGVAIEAERWSSAKPRELLLYLLCHPEGVARTKLGPALWPEASAAQAKNSFHVLLHRLRKALGDPELVVLENERYRLSPGLDVWFDAAVFEREVGAALAALAAGADAPGPLETALRLYRGDFLAEESVGAWRLEVHDRLHRLLVGGLSALADLRIARGELPAAIEVLERLVAAEDLHEDAYRRLMACLARTGQRERALRHYERLRAILEQDLDAEPEPETVALAERVRAGAIVAADA